MAIRTLINNYEVFKRILGFDFDPLEAVFEIENRDSKFWNLISNNDLLLGILLGFGRDNAWFYHWSIKHENQKNRMTEFLNKLPSKTCEIKEILAPTPINFELPIFGIFGFYPSTKQLDEYIKEQKFIKSLYRNQDEVDLALSWLTR